MRDGGAPSGGVFHLHGDSSLRREGLRGRIAARLDGGGTLHLEGERGGRLTIPAGLVERIRFDRVPTRSSGLLYRVLIWRAGRDRPLFLTLVDAHEAYGRAMRLFAARVASCAPSRVERGASPLQAALTIPLILLALGGMTAGAVWEALRSGSVWYWVYAAVMLFITIYGARIVRNDWPRPVRDLAELDALLPPG